MEIRQVEYEDNDVRRNEVVGNTLCKRARPLCRGSGGKLFAKRFVLTSQQPAGPAPHRTQAKYMYF